MSAILRADDLEPKMLVTVYAWRPVRLPTPYGEAMELPSPQQYGMGQGFLVVEVCLPYVKLLVLTGEGVGSYAVLDARQCSFMRFSDSMLDPRGRAMCEAHRASNGEPAVMAFAVTPEQADALRQSLAHLSKLNADPHPMCQSALQPVETSWHRRLWNRLSRRRGGRS